MNVKIYIGENEIVQSTTPTSQIIEFVSQPTTSDTISWDYYPAWPSTATTSTVTIPLLAIPSPYSNTQMAEDFKSFITGTTSNFDATVDGAEVDVVATNGSPIFNVVISGAYATSTPVYGDITVTNFMEIDLFKDENIGFTSKLSDIEKLSNVFTDFTNSFSVPATANNNDLFKHYYDVDIDNTFNANIRVLGYIEIDSFPFRYGKIQLEAIRLKDGRPEDYKMTFYGSAIQISDLFGDDTIDRLDYDTEIVNNREVFTKTRSSLSQFDYEYNSSNFADSIDSPGFKDGNVITPLISYTNRDWNYGSANSLDISTDAGAIIESELRPALRLYPIIEAIEDKYGISFSRNFFGTAKFKNLFIWLNEQTEAILGRKEDVEITVGLTGSPDAGNVQLVDNYIYITRQKYTRAGALQYIARVDYDVYPTNPSIEYSAFLVDENGNTIKQWLNVTGDQTFSKEWKSDFRLNGNESITVTEQFKLLIQSTQTIVFDTDVHVTYIRDVANMIDVYTDLYSLANPNTIQVAVTMEDNLPKMKVMDFFQGIMKMFKLIIRPLGTNVFYVNTIDGYYGDGNILDITPYIDQKSVNIERPLIYKTISFKYQKTNNVAGKQFRENEDPVNDEIGYGDLKAVYENIDEKNDLNVDLPFENMMFGRMTVLLPAANAGAITNLSIGQSISTNDDITYTPNKSKPILFYNNGTSNNSQFPIKISFQGTIGTFAYPYIIGNTDDEFIDQVTNTINWGAEIDPWHGQVVANSLYLNYWSNWIDTIYSLKQRKFTYDKCILPPRFAEELSLNDRLIIGDQRYKINDYTINLTNGETKFTLFKDIYDPYNTPEPDFNGKGFLATNMYLVDYTEANDRGSYWLYGSFTSYDGATATRVIKLNADGTQDKTFLTNLGGPNSNPFALVTMASYEDGRLLVGGFFTQYNGTARNRIARLNPNGTLDTTFSIGTGFNSSTERLLLQDDGNILVTGAFSSYNGTTRNRLARLTPTGSLDTTLSIGTGFNNVTLDAIQNPDGSYYVSGYFSQYNGNTANHVVKIGATGAIDNSFTTGATGFTPGGNNRVIGLLQDPNTSSFFVYGYVYTAYQGNPAGRIIKLTETGAPDLTFDAGTGFNDSVLSFRWTKSGNLFAGGAFTTYNGISTQKAIILNPNGNIIQTFPTSGLTNHYMVGDDVYATNISGILVKLTSQNTLNLSRNLITFNAAGKYFSFILFSDSDWTITKVDTGDGTDWVDVLTPIGSGNSSIEIFCQEKASQSPPTVYQPRTMYLKCTSGTIEKWVNITQNGLIS